MRNFLLLFAIAGITLAGFSQKRAMIPKELRDIVIERQHVEAIADINPFFNQVSPTASNGRDLTEEQIGTTWYDLQSNTAVGNRIWLFNDGTISAVWTMGHDDPPNFPDRGTGYNYFDGTSWGPMPTDRIETERCGWPSIAPFGEDGEITVSHIGTDDGLMFNHRPTKGTGAWTEFTFSGPEPDWKSILWPRVTTTGVNNDVIHLIHVTTPTANGGVAYNGMDPALLYSRSSDGGATWDPHHLQIEGTGPDYYNSLSADEYVWAEPRGNTIAFVCVDPWHDLFVMKSDDAGDNWEKHMVWEHPYPFFDWNVTITTDTLWAPDASADIAIDENGKVHVVVGLARVAHFEVGTTYQYWPYTDGVAYWNEDRPAFEAPDPHDALDAWDVLTEDYDLVGWIQDVDGNGTIDLLDELMSYRELGLTTMPEITITPANHMIILFSGTTEGYDNSTYNYKHIWARGYDVDLDQWLDFHDLNTDLIHIFDECIYPSMAGSTDEAFHVIYQADSEPGTALDEDHPYQENKIYYARMPLEDIGLPFVGMEEKIIQEETVSQNFPNPFGETTYIQVETLGRTDLTLEVSNLMGQKVMEINNGEVNAGNHLFKVNARDLTPGVYFYTVKAGEQSVTKKMIVE